MDSDGNGELSCEELFDYIDSRIDMVLDKEDMENREAIRDIVMETVVVVDKDGDGTWVNFVNVKFIKQRESFEEPWHQNAASGEKLITTPSKKTHH